MFSAIKSKYPDKDLTVSGHSWLYDQSIPPYRKLFPREYVESAIIDKRTRFQGLGCWGQFVNHQGSIKERERATFLKNLKGIQDPADLYQAFPYKTYNLRAPIDAFYKAYEIT